MAQSHFYPADLLLPAADAARFAVIACDQFTAQPDYWRQTEELVGDAPSALRLILPEVYLNDPPEEKRRRIAEINAAMRRYLQTGVFCTYPNAMVLVHRTTKSGLRRGLVGVIDLADYDYRPGAKSLIRATEQTVLERIPPRVEIRRDALLELPHVMLLYDDPAGRVLAAAESAAKGRALYDVELMQGGGHLTGWEVTPAAQQAIGEAFAALISGADPLLFLVGDGNHSLATAKACAEASPNPLARRALVEAVNLHDPAIQFEPIYRVVFGVNVPALLQAMRQTLGCPAGGGFAVTCCTAAGRQVIEVAKTAKLPVGVLQPFLDEYLAAHPAAKIDYIHGEEAVADLCREPDTVGFLFEGMKKEELFDAVRQDGPLPRKTFSMGSAEEKRYYMEARRIREE